MIKLKAAVCAVTHAGNVLSENEDNFVLNGRTTATGELKKGSAYMHNVYEPFYLAVCDGSGGERASDIACRSIIEHSKEVTEAGDDFGTPLATCLRDANQKICDEISASGTRIGTTVAAMYAIKGKLICVNVGNSRIYRFSDGALELLTDDSNSRNLGIFPDEAPLSPGVCVIEDSQDGYTIDFDKVTDDVIEAIKNEEYSKVITVEGTVTEPENSAEFLRGYLCKVSSATSTTTSSYNRNVNIDLVCKKLDGLVLQPGEQFDFNTYIGQRTAEAGYKEAGGIYNGALRQELGGGICQANAMIFHCVVKADLQVDERSPHTWPSDYVQIGTDATVSWGGPEFKFTNTSDYPIALHAYYGNQKVTVELYGRPLDDGMYILFKGEEVSRVTAKVEYIADSSMSVGERETERSAHDQIKAQSYKVYYDKDGNEIKRELAFTSNYPMINKKVRVGTLGPDGVTIFKLDKETGEVTPPEGYVEPTPEPTDEPEPTENPDPTDSPNPTDSPEPTEAPEVTETPDPTHTPDPTEAPEPTPDDDDDPSQGTEDDNIPWG